MGVTGVLRICFKDNEVIRKRQTLDKPQHLGPSYSSPTGCPFSWEPWPEAAGVWALC